MLTSIHDLADSTPALPTAPLRSWARALPRVLATGARLLLGLTFFVCGLNGFLNFLPAPSGPMPAAAVAFGGALFGTGYMMPLIAGTELVATAGQEFRGRWLSEITPNEPDLEQVMTLYYRVIATRVPIFGRTDSSTLRLGVEFFEWVLCPLSEDGQTVTHFFGLEDYVSTRRYLGGYAQ